MKQFNNKVDEFHKSLEKQVWIRSNAINFMHIFIKNVGGKKVRAKDYFHLFLTHFTVK